MPTPTLVFSSSTGHVRLGWDAFDRDVLSTFRTADVCSFSDVVRSLPAGLHFSEIRGALSVLVHAGYLTSSCDTGPWELTDAGRDRLADLTAARSAA